MMVATRNTHQQIDSLQDSLNHQHMTGEIWQHHQQKRNVAFNRGGLSSSAVDDTAVTSLCILENNRVGYSHHIGQACVTATELLRQARTAARLSTPIDFEPFAPTNNANISELMSPKSANLTALTHFAGECWQYLRQVVPDWHYNILLNAVDNYITRHLVLDGAPDIPQQAQQRHYQITLQLALDGNDRFYSMQRVVHTHHLDELSAETLCQDCLRALQHEQQEVEVEHGQFPVIFMPNAFATLLSFMTSLWHGHSILKGISPLGNKVGQAISNQAFTLFDDTRSGSGSRGFAFDGEGSLTQKTPLVEKGVLRNFFTDRRTAQHLGVPLTGNVRRDFAEHPTLQAGNLIVASGTADFATTLAAMNDGLLVYEITGGGYTDVLEGYFSVKSTLSYRIQHGEIVGRVRNLVLTGSFLDLLQKIIAIGNQQQAFHYIRTPFIACDDIYINGSRGQKHV
jgi:PmbA protein